MATVARVHNCAVLGGEPLLNPSILEVLSIIRESNVANFISVWTNGVGLERMGDDFFRAIDTLEMNVYPRVMHKFDREYLAEKSREFGFQYALHHVSQFQETHVNVGIDNPPLVKEIYKRCKSKGEWNCHTVADGYYYKCSRSAILSDRLRISNQSVDNRAIDGVRLVDNPNLLKELSEYLASSEPLLACNWCLGSDGATFKHTLLNKSKAREEAEHLTRFSPELLSADARRDLSRFLDSQV